MSTGCASSTAKTPRSSATVGLWGVHVIRQGVEPPVVQGMGEAVRRAGEGQGSRPRLLNLSVLQEFSRRSELLSKNVDFQIVNGVPLQRWLVPHVSEDKALRRGKQEPIEADFSGGFIIV